MEWIDFKKQRPEDGQRILIACTWDGFFAPDVAAVIYKDGRYLYKYTSVDFHLQPLGYEGWELEFVFCEEYITYWMPFPEPPGGWCED